MSSLRERTPHAFPALESLHVISDVACRWSMRRAARAISKLNFQFEGGNKYVGQSYRNEQTRLPFRRSRVLLESTPLRIYENQNPRYSRSRTYPQWRSKNLVPFRSRLSFRSDLHRTPLLIFRRPPHRMDNT